MLLLLNFLKVTATVRLDSIELSNDSKERGYCIGIDLVILLYSSNK